MKHVYMATTALCAAAGVAQATIITQWNFNSTTGTTTPSTGAGSASLVGGTTATFAGGNASGGSSDPDASAGDFGWNISTFPAAGVGNETAGVQFAASTVGFSSITVTFDQRHSNSSNRYFAFYYSTNGTTFSRISLSGGNASAGATPAGGAPASTPGLFGASGTFSAFDSTVTGAGDDWFNGRGVDLSLLPGVANNPNFAFRIVSSFDTGAAYVSSSGVAYGTTGTSRFDMVTINGVVPTPGTAVLAGFGLAVAAGVRRRK